MYSRAVRHPFVDYDDNIYVTNNLHVQAGLTWDTFKWAWTTREADNWHPVTWFSHALDCKFFGLNPAGHHLTSVLLHVINVLLLFLLLERATGAVGRSGLVAAMFALHPINVESVAWVAERKNVLSTLLFLLALGAYGWYSRQPNVRRYLVLALLFALGLAAKPMVITLPFLLLTLDIWPLQRITGWDARRSSTAEKRKKRRERSAEVKPAAESMALRVTQEPAWRLLLEKIPLLIFCVGSAAITILAQQTNAIRTLAKFPLDVRLENAIYAYAMYMWKMAWPTRLAVYYPHPGTSLGAWQIVLALLFLAGVSGLAWKERVSRSYLLAGWLWYLISLVPVIGLVQVGDQAMADRYAYLPFIGIFVMVVWGVADLADARAVGVWPRTVVAVGILGALALLTWRQIGYWNSNYDLWSHTVQATGNNVIADEKLSIALAQLGRDEEAIPGLEMASRLNPSDPTRHANLGKELIAVGRWDDALVEYQQAIEAAPNLHIYPQWKERAVRNITARCYESLATIYDELGNFSEMRNSYRQALKIDPQQGPDMVDRIAYYADNQPSGKRYLQVAVLLQELGRTSEAEDAYQQAIQLDPAMKEAKEALDRTEHAQ